LFAREKWDDAVAAYDKVLVKYSTSSVVPSAYLQKGLTLEKAGKPAEAVPVYEAVARKYPHRQEASSAQLRLEALKNPPVPAEPPR
ncbi:MAG TPA: tetratricopeptide repeat protein, partial [Elusimicrobiota bacterium]|nr:tetratricopeptide repeat protein [Elusimicrobiota bacterium]